MSRTVPNPGTLEVPGAELHYEVSGAGPVLLLIPGGPMPGAGFAPMLAHLVNHFTVVTYDPRGLSRSTRDDPDADITVDEQADDAGRLLAAITTEPALVFGSSSGAITGLVLAGRHPEQVRTLIAHEPPVTALLPDAAWFRESSEAVSTAYRRDGIDAAMARFLADAGLDGHDTDEAAEAPDPEQTESMAAMRANMEVFIGHMFRSLGDYRPDIGALRLRPEQIIVATGTADRDGVAYRAAIALAAELGTAVAEFPGDHGGFGGEQEAFAATLRDVVTESG